MLKLKRFAAAALGLIGISPASARSAVEPAESPRAASPVVRRRHNQPRREKSDSLKRMLAMKGRR